MDYGFNYDFNSIGFNEVNIDGNKLLSMGFTIAEVQNLEHVYYNGGKFTPSALQSYGYTYEQAQRLAYMYKLCTNVISVDTKEQQIKHLRKMFGHQYRISIQDLAVSRVTEVPRLAVVDGILEEPFTLYNSKNYTGKDAMYKVVDVTGQKITVETSKKPKLKWKQSKVIPGVLEIKGLAQSGKAIVVFDKKVCRLCNRFIILASLKNPEFHLGKWEIICFEGTKVYVYATSMGTSDKVKYKMGNQRVYDYGVFPQHIQGKLDNATKELYNHLHGVQVEFEGANTDYCVVPSDDTDNLNRDEYIDEDGVDF